MCQQLVQSNTDYNVKLCLEVSGGWSVGEAEPNRKLEAVKNETVTLKMLKAAANGAADTADK